MLFSVENCMQLNYWTCKIWHKNIQYCSLECMNLHSFIFFIEDFNRMFLTFSFFAVRKHLRLRKMKNIGKYKVVCCLKNPFSIVLQTLECLIALLYIPWFSNYRHCSKVPDCHGIMHIQSQLVLLAIHDKLFHHETYCIEYFKRMHLHHI